MENAGKSKFESNNLSFAIIYVPMGVVKIKCKQCKMEFAIIAILEKGNYALQGSDNGKLYCPYCGKHAY